MALSTIVKVGNVSNLSDARYCAGMGVHYLGFSLDPRHKAFIDPSTFKSIREWIVGPTIVGEFPLWEPESISGTLDQYDLDCIEISDPAHLIYISRNMLPPILKLDLTVFQKLEDMVSILKECREQVAFFIIERSGTSIIQLEDILRLTDQYKLMIGLEIDRGSLHQWINDSGIYGISMKGGREEVTGFKDYDELADILEMIEVD